MKIFPISQTIGRVGSLKLIVFANSIPTLEAILWV